LVSTASPRRQTCPSKTSAAWRALAPNRVLANGGGLADRPGDCA